MEQSQYEQLYSNLAASNRVTQPVPILNETINDYKVVAKNAIEGIGSITSVSALQSGLKMATSSSRFLRKSGLSRDDADELLEAAKSGDFSKLGDRLSNNLSKAVSKLVNKGKQAASDAADTASSAASDAADAARGAASDAADAVGAAADAVPSVISSGVSEASREAAQISRSGENLVSSDDGGMRIGANLTGDAGDAGDAITAAASEAAPEAAEAAPAVMEAGEGAAEAASTAVTVASDSEKALSALSDVAKASSLADIDPVNLAITGVLSIASIVGGLFIHPRKVVKLIPPKAVVPNMSVQVGLQ
mgnify:CR=1 FL=1|tara:strand:- start:800 stop:1720 length:921 start_codon:yes stop_codon:yes gene_type:complete